MEVNYFKLHVSTPGRKAYIYLEEDPNSSQMQLGDTINTLWFWFRKLFASKSVAGLCNVSGTAV